jgi:maltodextrin utilization protein YvdJ
MPILRAILRLKIGTLSHPPIFLTFFVAILTAIILKATKKSAKIRNPTGKESFDVAVRSILA